MAASEEKHLQLHPLKSSSKMKMADAQTNKVSEPPTAFPAIIGQTGFRNAQGSNAINFISKKDSALT